MSKLAGWLVPVGIGAVIYAFTLGSTDPVDYLVGLVLAAGLSPLIRQFMVKSRVQETGVPSPPAWQRLVWFPVFLAVVTFDIIRGTRDVLMYTIGLRSWENAGIIRVPIGERSHSGVAVTAWAITVSPGSAYVETDWETDEMLIHVLEADHADEIRRAYQEFYDRYQRRIFP
jgi:multisubunit Na+/H+ antiporter MnhE subunit